MHEYDEYGKPHLALFLALSRKPISFEAVHCRRQSSRKPMIHMLFNVCSCGEDKVA